MKTYIRTLLATLGHLLVDRFERHMNAAPFSTSAEAKAAWEKAWPEVAALRAAAKPINFGQVPPPFPPQIKPPVRWHRVAVHTSEIPHVHCYVCKRLAPWELADPCPGPRT